MNEAAFIDRIIADYGVVGIIAALLIFYRKPLIEAMARQASDPTLEALRALKNTSEEQARHFANNNQMFAGIAQAMPLLAQEMKAHREATEESLQVLRAMHVELIRSERGK